MPKKDLLGRFTDALNKMVSNKKELVYQIADLLHIEKESAYRRLSGKVHFTVREVGILAKEMDISLDSLLNKGSENSSIPFKLNFIFTPATIDLLVNTLEESVSFQKQAKIKDAEVGSVVNSLPIEFFTFYTHLCRFMYFKWGRNYVGTKEYDNFSSWKVPERLLTAHSKYLENFSRYKSIFYIWDNPIIWNLASEIRYYRQINVLSTEDVELIKSDLHLLLDDMEDLLRGSKKMNPYDLELRFYITNFNISTTSNYIFYNNSYLTFIRATFLQSAVNHDYETGHRIYQWINSIKKFSSLISGSGEKDRKIFFIEQHTIVDSLLGESAT